MRKFKYHRQFLVSTQKKCAYSIYSMPVLCVSIFQLSCNVKSDVGSSWFRKSKQQRVSIFFKFLEEIISWRNFNDHFLSVEILKKVFKIFLKNFFKNFLKKTGKKSFKKILKIFFKKRGWSFLVVRNLLPNLLYRITSEFNKISIN